MLYCKASLPIVSNYQQSSLLQSKISYSKLFFNSIAIPREFVLLSFRKQLPTKIPLLHKCPFRTGVYLEDIKYDTFIFKKG